MKRTRKAYTLAELVTVSVIVGVMAAIAVPRFNLAAVHKQTADTVARKVVTDLRRTRMMAIANAAGNSLGYELKMSGPSPYSSYEIKNIDTSATLDMHSIDSQVSCSGGSTFQFAPLGNLISGSDTAITVSSSGRSFTITVTSATGMVKCVEN
ncbi:MAG: prepilin-type N-terminal cleavage/methylation domain-containing protein [Planctomycetes bacterium]|nr:prepilin-type N-terminal cleavage/methylation domain-containing protein [Planctomycetota bacterium]